MEWLLKRVSSSIGMNALVQTRAQAFHLRVAIVHNKTHNQFLAFFHCFPLISERRTIIFIS